MAGQCGLEREGFWFSISIGDCWLLCGMGSITVRHDRGVRRVGVGDGHRPDFSSVIGGTCCELLDVGRQEDSSDVLLVRRKLCQRDKLRVIVTLEK